VRGSTTVRREIIAHLQEAAHLPSRIAALRDAGANVRQIAEGEWHPAWKPEENCTNWPTLCITTRTSTNQGREDFVNGDPEHRWLRTFRIFIWERGDGYEECADRTENIADAIAEEFLARPGIADGADSMYVLDAPMSVARSTYVDRDGASIAGAYIEFVVSMTETATIPPLWDGGELDLDLIVGPKDPA